MSPYREMAVKEKELPKSVPNPNKWKFFRRIVHLFVKHEKFANTGNKQRVKFQYYTRDPNSKLFDFKIEQLDYRMYLCACGARFTDLSDVLGDLNANYQGEKYFIKIISKWDLE